MHPSLQPARQGQLAIAGAVALWIGLSAQAEPVAPPPVQRQAALRHLLAQDCGSCHGLTMKGGLGSPLTPAALADKPEAGLVATILYGRPGTAMPPWQAFMNEAEARWLVEILKHAQADAPR